MKKNKLLLSLGSLSIFSAIPFIAAKCDNTETKDNNNNSSSSSKEPGITNPGTTEKENIKVDLGKLSDKVKEELNKLAKEKVTKEEVVAVLKTEKGLEKLTTEDLTKVEFKDNKLTIEANKDSKLVSGTHVFNAQVQPHKADSVIDLSTLQLNADVKKALKIEAKINPDKKKIIEAFKKDSNFTKLTEDDFEATFKDTTLTIKSKPESTVIKGELQVHTKTELDNVTLTENIKKELQAELQKELFNAEEIVKVLRKLPELKDLDAKKAEFKKENNKLIVTAKKESIKFTGSLSFIFKVALDKTVVKDIKNELSSEVKKDPSMPHIVNILKKIPGLVTISANDVKVEFKDNKLVITAMDKSEIVMGSVSVEKSKDSAKINLSSYDFTEKDKKSILNALSESDDSEGGQIKSSVWFSLTTIFKGRGIEESDFEVTFDKDKKTLTIKASKETKKLEDEKTFNE
ncbi:variable surface lipoprotein [Mycoplasmopsis bovis]|uniref:variable surface lipoprotein n=1 Tax=Mycoplasmopsis bovis TaxID=28903 RepID=UPI00279C06C4